MGREYGVTPFDLVTASYAAFDFNRAAYLFGRSVDNLLDQRKEETVGSGRNRRTVQKPKYTFNQAIEEALRNAGGKPKHKHIATLFAALDAEDHEYANG